MGHVVLGVAKQEARGRGLDETKQRNLFGLDQARSTEVDGASHYLIEKAGCRQFRIYQPSTKLAECRGLAPLARRHAFVSTEARLACPVGIPAWDWCRVRDLASQARHKMGPLKETFAIANRGPPPTSPS